MGENSCRNYSPTTLSNYSTVPPLARSRVIWSGHLQAKYLPLSLTPPIIIFSIANLQLTLVYSNLNLFIRIFHLRHINQKFIFTTNCELRLSCNKLYLYDCDCFKIRKVLLKKFRKYCNLGEYFLSIKINEIVIISEFLLASDYRSNLFEK